MKFVIAKCKIWKRKQSETHLLQLFSMDEHCALIVSPRMNIIASRDQFKPIRIGENFVVNYKGWKSMIA